MAVSWGTPISHKSVLLLPKMNIDRTIFVLFFFRPTCSVYLHMGSLFIYCTSLLYFSLLTCMPSIGTLQVSPVHSPPYRQPLDLKPITQELITEDGQRISVDVNLRLISPPVGVETEMAGYGRQPPANHRQTGLQYPVESMSNGQVCLVDWLALWCASFVPGLFATHTGGRGCNSCCSHAAQRLQVWVLARAAA